MAAFLYSKYSMSGIKTLHVQHTHDTDMWNEHIHTGTQNIHNVHNAHL